MISSRCVCFITNIMPHNSRSYLTGEEDAGQGGSGSSKGCGQCLSTTHFLVGHSEECHPSCPRIDCSQSWKGGHSIGDST
jgi:hypothetical protein